MADYTDIDKLRELAESDDYAEFGSETVLALIAEVGQLRGERDELRRDASQGEVEIARLRDAMRRCNAVGHPSVTPETLIPCQLDRDHDGDHYSTSGCSGGAVSWPRAEAERDALQAQVAAAHKINADLGEQSARDSAVLLRQGQQIRALQARIDASSVRSRKV